MKQIASQLLIMCDKIGAEVRQQYCLEPLLPRR